MVLHSNLGSAVSFVNQFLNIFLTAVDWILFTHISVVVDLIFTFRFMGDAKESHWVFSYFKKKPIMSRV